VIHSRETLRERTQHLKGTRVLAFDKVLNASVTLNMGRENRMQQRPMRATAPDLVWTMFVTGMSWVRIVDTDGELGPFLPIFIATVSNRS
jgi:hypothetical protein